MTSLQFGLLAVIWVAASIVFAAVICPRLMRFAPGG